jgi:spermidine/putrescine-binding protein
MLDDPRLGLGAGLKWLSLSLNSRSAEELARASDLLSSRRSTLRVDAAAWSDALLTGAVAVAQARSNDAAFAQSANANLRYVVPREGAPLWLDCLVLPKDSAEAAQAGAFADFLLRPDISAQLSVQTYSLSSVPEAYNRMESGLAALFRSGYIPDDDTFKRSEFIADVGAAQADYDRIWTDLKR